MATSRKLAFMWDTVKGSPRLKTFFAISTIVSLLGLLHSRELFLVTLTILLLCSLIMAYGIENARAKKKHALRWGAANGWEILDPTEEDSWRSQTPITDDELLLRSGIRENAEQKILVEE